MQNTSHARQTRPQSEGPRAIRLEDFDQANASSRPLRALVIEDSEFDRKRLARICSDSGLLFNITALDGAANLRTALDANRFDVIMVDFHLPDGDGLEVVRRIRAHPAHMGCALLMLTGQAQLTVAVEAMRLGCSDFIEKSRLSPNALRHAMLNALEKSALQEDLMRARGVTHKLRGMMEDYALDSTAEMKPLVLQLMRQARARIGAHVAKRDPDAEEMDKTCRKLWGLLEAMEKNAKSQ